MSAFDPLRTVARDVIHPQMGQAAALIVIFGLYLVAPTFLVIGGRLGLAGGAMLTAALIPVAIARLGNIDNPALGLITVLMLPLPLFVLLLAAVGGTARRLRRSPENTSG